MEALIRYFRGYLNLRFTGAAPEMLLNLLAAENIPFWDFRLQGELGFCLCVYSRDYGRVEKLAIRAFCIMEIGEKRGFSNSFRGLLRRPVILLGVLVVLLGTVLLQNIVWTIEVEGNSTVHEKEIIRALETLDIKVGAWAPGINSQKTKQKMLNLIPELSWLAVNRTGGHLQVLVTERSLPDPEVPPYEVANVIASRDGVLTEITVLEGMKLCASGDTVSAGQLLVSGYEDYGLRVRGVCANAEIYATTWHTGTVVTPAQQWTKCYTGEEWVQKTLVIGRKRINLFGNSRISTEDCDKMIDVQVLSLPKGHELPFKVETVLCRKYELVPSDADAGTSRVLLSDAWERMTLESMIAGKITDTSATMVRVNGVYALHSTSTCEEMIARLVPAEELYKGETYE